ncbi:Os06g0605950, partial [Oryza sativa Japonica Group]
LKHHILFNLGRLQRLQHSTICQQNQGSGVEKQPHRVVNGKALQNAPCKQAAQDLNWNKHTHPKRSRTPGH